MADAGERNLERIKRAGADVAVDDAERSERQKPQIARVMSRWPPWPARAGDSCVPTADEAAGAAVTAAPIGLGKDQFIVDLVAGCAGCRPL